jgi:hypothetical protein
MDTNIAGRLEIQVDDEGGAPPYPNGATEEDRLKPFRTLETGDRHVAGSPASSTPEKGRRNTLMISACSVAVLVTAAGIFWISPHNHYTLRDATNLATHVRDIALNKPTQPAPLVAPAARLARAPEPTAPPPGFRPAPPAQQATAGDDMAEFLRLGGQAAPPSPPDPGTWTPAKPTHVLVTPPPAPDPRTAPATQAASTQVAVRQATPSVATGQITHQPPPTVESDKPAAPIPPPPAPAAQSVVVGPPAPQDVVAKVVALRPAPMTEPEQVQVLELVTQLGILVRDQRAEIAQLRQDQKNLSQRVDGSLTDVSRRLSLAEARGAVSAAMDLQTAQPQTNAATPTAVVALGPPANAKAAPPTATPGNATTPRYHVQAASPGLAMLSALDASGGQEQQLPVSPGDSVPGWGKVISISQRGATWIVKTDHGLIQ